jgi:hypothetical protein
MKNYIILFLFTFIFTSTLAFSQNESGTRYLDSIAFKSAGYWYDNSNSMFQMQYPIIRSIPPLSIGMPYEILLSYIYLDSLLRFSTDFQQDSLLNTWNVMNDTIANSIKYFYKIMDYDPIIFNQYVGEVSINKKNDTIGKYLSNLYDLKNKIAFKLKDFANTSEKNALFTLLYSDYILKIQVINIDSTTDKRAPDFLLGRKRYNVYAMVLDTIKGKNFINQYQEGNAIAKDNKSSIQVQNPSIISFQYLNICYYQHPYYPDIQYLNIQNDSAFMNGSGGFVMHPNQKAIVFLRHCNHLFDYQNDYFDLDIESLSSNNALPEIDGYVRDINNIWSETTLQSYAVWKENIMQLIQKILTGQY